MKAHLVFIIQLAFIIISGCIRNTDDLLKELRINELTLERDNLLQSKSWFSTKPTRSEQGDIILFVSTDILNRVLEGAENISIHIPQNPKIEINVTKITTDFRDDFPLLQIIGTATIPGWFRPLQIDLKISALLDLDPIFLNAPDTKLKVKIIRIVPKVRYNILRCDIHKAVEAIISTEAVEYSGQLPEFTVPLEKTIFFNIPSQEHWQMIDLPSKWEMGTKINTPGLNRNLILNVQQALALKNGIYVFSIVECNNP